MKTFSFYFQVSILGLSAGCGLLLLFDSPLGMWALVFQFIIGCFQYFLSSVLMLGEHRPKVKLHWYVSTATIMLLLLLSATDVPSQFVAFSILAFGFPWLLALYFLYISYQLYKSPAR